MTQEHATKTGPSRVARALVSGALLGMLSLTTNTASAEYVGNKYTEPGSGEELEYNVFVPDGYDPAKKYPLMLVMHAATNVNPPNRTLSRDGKGWSSNFVDSAHQRTDPSFFMVPISQTNRSGWGDPLADVSSEQKFEGRLAVSVLKQVVMKKYNIDPARLYITGPSMGGRGTWDIIRRNPTLFAAAAPTAAPAMAKDAELYKNQNIWAVCGERDPIVQPGRDTILAIRKAGGNPIYTELAGRGHDSWRASYNDPYFLTWMYAQRLGVPWWTVSKAPTGIAGAPITKGWAIVDPPSDLPGEFGGVDAPSGTDAGTTNASSDAGATPMQPGASRTNDAGANDSEEREPVDSARDAGADAAATAPTSSSTTTRDAAVATRRDAASAMGTTAEEEREPANESDEKEPEAPVAPQSDDGCSLAGNRSSSEAFGALSILLAVALGRRRRGRSV